MHSTEIKVRGYHLDVYQHVNNARYLEFLEEARWSFFEGYPLTQTVHEQKLAFVLVNININYRRPAFLNELLQIHTKISKIGNKSCTVQQLILESESKQVVADAEITFCVLNQETHKAVSIEGEVRQVLEAMYQADAVDKEILMPSN